MHAEWTSLAKLQEIEIADKLYKIHETYHSKFWIRTNGSKKSNKSGSPGLLDRYHLFMSEWSDASWNKISMVSWIPKHMCICQKYVVSADTRLCEESVECKVARKIRWTVNKFQCGFSTLAGSLILLNFVSAQLRFQSFIFLIIGSCDLVQFVYLFLFTHLPWPGQVYTV